MDQMKVEQMKVDQMKVKLSLGVSLNLYYSGFLTNKPEKQVKTATSGRKSQ